MAKGETGVLNAVWKRASALGWRLFRNNVGVGTMSNGAFVRFGLRVGSGDLIGWRPVTVTQDMVGTVIAQFVSVEVKTATGRLSEDQVHWAEQVRSAGGVAITARSENDLEQQQSTSPSPGEP